jgi:hypothetical protein
VIHLALLFAGGINCPVLNTPTARGAIGEVTQATVTHAEQDTGYTCQFIGAEVELTISIGKLAGPERFAKFVDDECESGRDIAVLKAIGNEAKACSLGGNGQMAEKAVGRVRNQSFVVRLKSTDKMASGKDLRNKVTGLAEIVAGNLF